MSDTADAQVLPTFQSQDVKCKKEPCPQQPGTILRIFIPAGAVINLLNLIEVSSPSGICLIVRIPLLAGLTDSNGRTLTLADIRNAVTSCGGTIEVM